MARPLRIEFPGAVYYLISRGNENKPVFLADKDRNRFLNLLADVNAWYHYQQDHAGKERDAQEIGLTQLPILETGNPNPQKYLIGSVKNPSPGLKDRRPYSKSRGFLIHSVRQGRW